LSIGYRANARSILNTQYSIQYMTTKAIALISGGLDSLLAAKVVQEEGIDVLGVCFTMSFASRDIEDFKRKVKVTADRSGIPLEFADISEKFLAVLKSPEHGYGGHLNPCIDCKILMLEEAKKMMAERHASFVVTGEVLGERPMSQGRWALDRIMQRSGLEGYLLRPLSAKLLDETVAEKEGLILRGNLLDISGRSREHQLRLADKYGIKDFFQPAGGCLLTDPQFSKRIKDLIDHDKLDLEEIKLLSFGRHFRIDERTKAVVGRDEKDTKGILSLKRQDDIIFRLKDKSGPYVILRGDGSPANIEMSASLCVSHSKYRESPQPLEVEYWTDESSRKTMPASSLDKEKIEAMRI